jgi:uncharacterized membrane protein YeiH
MTYFTCFELSFRLVMAIPANLLMMLGVAGLSFFAIAGTEKPGCTRCTRSSRFYWRVVEADVYATAALAGSVVMVLGRKLRLSPAVTDLSGGVVCFGFA